MVRSRSIRSIIKKIIIMCYHIMRHMFPVSPDRIVFNSNLGKSYSGNPKYIYEYLARHGLDHRYKCVWFYESEPYDIPGKVRQVKFGRFCYLYYMATAKMWIFDCRQPDFLVKRKNTMYIQTWHGTPLKKLALDMDDVFMVGETTIEVYKESFRKNVMTWDYLISQNSFSSKTFRRAFEFRETMLEIGYPRNDILVHQNNIDDIYTRKVEMGLPLDKKIILYAPTWRDDEYYGKGKYKFNPDISFEQLKKEIGQDFVIILKYHYLVMENIDWGPYIGFIYQFDKSFDIAELYLVSDMLITDYSSVMFDYSILGRPMLFYAYDLDQYRDKLRGFYFNFEQEAPGPISQNTDELIQHILHYKKESYKERYKKFTDKYNKLDDGNASQKIAVLIDEKMKK